MDILNQNSSIYDLHKSGNIKWRIHSDQINNEQIYSNSFYMIFNNNFYSNNKLMNKKSKNEIYDNFHRIRCYGFTGRNNPKIDYKNITLYFCGVIYNYDEIIQKCLPDVKEFVNLYSGIGCPRAPYQERDMPHSGLTPRIEVKIFKNQKSKIKMNLFILSIYTFSHLKHLRTA